jgi:chromosome segregation ATPase
MFENLRNAFREAVENFNKELARDQVPETVDRLLKGMRDEVADAKVQIRELEDQIARTDAEVEREKGEVTTARRRGKMAQDIGDTETSEIATQYAARHEERHRVLEQKAAALRQELELRRNEVEEMMEKVKEAQSKRDSLAATTGRSGARQTLHFAELDRMAEKIGAEDARARAAEAMDEVDLEGVGDYEPPPRAPEPDIDERLAELKRRMGKE